MQPNREGLDSSAFSRFSTIHVCLGRRGTPTFTRQVTLLAFSRLARIWIYAFSAAFYASFTQRKDTLARKLPCVVNTTEAL